MFMNNFIVLFGSRGVAKSISVMGKPSNAFLTKPPIKRMSTLASVKIFINLTSEVRFSQVCLDKDMFSLKLLSLKLPPHNC